MPPIRYSFSACTQESCSLDLPKRICQVLLAGKAKAVIGVVPRATLLQSERMSPKSRQARPLHVYRLPDSAHWCDLSLGLGHYCSERGVHKALEQSHA